MGLGKWLGSNIGEAVDHSANDLKEKSKSAALAIGIIAWILFLGGLLLYAGVFSDKDEFDQETYIRESLF